MFDIRSKSYAVNGLITYQIKISAKYELQRILVSRFPPGAKLSEHFAKKNERRRSRQRGGAQQPSLPAGGRVAAEAAAIKFVHK